MVIYKQTEKSWGRFSNKSGVLTDFAIDEVVFEVNEDNKDKMFLVFKDFYQGLLIEIKTEDFLYLSRLLEKYLELLEKPDGE
jgi:hypothetical protein